MKKTVDVTSDVPIIDNLYIEVFAVVIFLQHFAGTMKLTARPVHIHDSSPDRALLIT